MRHVSKGLALAVALLAIGVMSSGVRADDMVAGSFKLPHAIAWKGTMLPAGDYRFKLVRTQSDVHVLSVEGSKKALDVLVFAQAACQTCRKSELTLAVNGDSRIVTSMELPGYHVDFKSSWTKAEREEQAHKPMHSPEQVAVQVNPN
jgi:hypothetical protein